MKDLINFIILMIKIKYENILQRSPVQSLQREFK